MASSQSCACSHSACLKADDTLNRCDHAGEENTTWPSSNQGCQVVEGILAIVFKSSGLSQPLSSSCLFIISCVITSLTPQRLINSLAKAMFMLMGVVIIMIGIITNNSPANNQRETSLVMFAERNLSSLEV